MAGNFLKITKPGKDRDVEEDRIRLIFLNKHIKEEF